ncbi:hypothetical protein [Colwellia sp. 20A7]|uniref:hypothetical protein n=1 Tax=Colwellia sp. 20A7 TaxID=2689569 RepID=UPI0013592AE0|nr:hypothetical protein [Colwellia sp. 20A7]
MFQDEHQVIKAIYDHFYSLDSNGVIPINLRAPTLVGTTQDDPFDCLIEHTLSSAFPQLEVFSSGKLMTPDIIVRDRASGIIVGIEVKKLIQKPNGADSRGLTMDYNSCLPCGKTQIKVGKMVTDIPCYYLFALLSNDSSSIVTLILMHGDFINNDFELHKYAKTANQSEYGHGAYGEGSVRHRAMYTYVNPLNSKLSSFFGRKTFVLPKAASDQLGYSNLVAQEIVRTDLQGNDNAYSVVDNSVQPQLKPTELRDIFANAKARKAKERNSASMPQLDEI